MGGEAGGSLWVPVWSTEWVLGQQRLHRETLPWKTKKIKKLKEIKAQAIVFWTHGQNYCFFSYHCMHMVRIIYMQAKHS